MASLDETQAYCEAARESIPNLSTLLRSICWRFVRVQSEESGLPSRNHDKGHTVAGRPVALIAIRSFLLNVIAGWEYAEPSSCPLRTICSINWAGGLGRLVKDRTVGIKIDMVGGQADGFDPVAVEDSYRTHPRVAGALLHLIGRAGARRIGVVEGA